MAGGDRDRVIIAEVIARCWQDATFQGEFMHEPKAKLKEAGMAVPDDTKVHVFRSDNSVTYMGLSHTMKPEEYLTFVGEHLKALMPLAPDHEIRVVQSAPGYLPIIIPVPPKSFLKGELTEAELASVAGGGYLWEAVNVGTSANAVAEANAAAVQNVAGATEAVAAAVIAVVLL